MRENILLLIKAIPSHWGATTVGFSVAFGLASLFLMSPPQMLRWVFASGTNEEKVARALDPIPAFDDLQKRLVEANTNFAQCTKDRLNSDKIDSAADSASRCIQALDGVKDVFVRRDEAMSFFGERLHLTVSGNPGQYDGGCPFSFGTDLQSFDVRAVRFGMGVIAKTSIGDYLIIPKTWKDKFWPLKYNMRGCVFDIVRVPSILPPTGSLPSAVTPKGDTSKKRVD